MHATSTQGGNCLQMLLEVWLVVDHVQDNVVLQSIDVLSMQ